MMKNNHKRARHVFTHWDLPLFSIFLVLLTCLTRCEPGINASDSKGLDNPMQIGVSANHGKISIDGDAALMAFPNKTGSGTPTEPYFIKDLVIDAGGTGSAILINNTNAWLIIQNCTLTNTGDQYWDAGVWLNNSRNVNITRNRVFSNKCFGISIIHCSAIKLLSNNVSLATINGMAIVGGNNTIISDNNVSLTQNNWGIYVWDVKNCTISNNVGSMNFWSCIYLGACFNNTVANNTCDGIYLEQANNNMISNNTMIRSNSNADGIHLGTSANNTISNNTVKMIPGYDMCGYGIYIGGANNSVKGNNVSLNNNTGIYVYRGFLNNISENYVYSNNKTGIQIQQSNNCTISKNIVYMNKRSGIVLSLNNYSHTINNTSCNNSEYGIALSAVYNGTVSGNNVFLNREGILLDCTADDTVWDNALWRNWLYNARNHYGWRDKWNNGLRGNFYGDYVSRYPLATNNGVYWITPYLINGTAILYDTKPLVRSPCNSAPVLSSPADINYTHGEIEHELSWNATDTDMDSTSYTIYHNGISSKSGSWNQSTPITILVDGLAVGVHNYTIIVGDGLGGVSQDTAFVTVFNIEPVIDTPSDVTYVQGTGPHSITWVVSDASTHNPTYIVYRNATVFETGNWMSGLPIEIDLDRNTAGIFNYTIIINDGYGGFVQDTVIATVESAPGISAGQGWLLLPIIAFAGVGIILRIKRRKMV